MWNKNHENKNTILGFCSSAVVAELLKQQIEESVSHSEFDKQKSITQQPKPSGIYSDLPDLPCLKDYQLKTLQSVGLKAFIQLMWEVDLRANIYYRQFSSR